MKITTRVIVYIAVIAALYAVFTVMIAPLSYGPIQFRISEFLKVFVLINPMFALGIGIGTFFANMISPMAGPWELIWMPLTDMIGGVIAYFIYQGITRLARRKGFFIRALFPMIVYALTTGAAVGLMLQMMGVDVFTTSTLLVSGSELVILVGGIPVVAGILKILNAMGIDLSLWERA